MLSDIHKYFTFGIHICSFTSKTTHVVLVWQTYLFLEMPIKFKVTFTNILTLAAVLILSHLC